MIDLARRAAEEAGALLLERFGRLAAGEIERRGRRDLVTAADREAEASIRRRLAAGAPDVPMLGEEEAHDTGTRPALDGEGPVWVVDPLDGTVNFVQGLPVFAVSIGLVERGQPVLGVVHMPVLGWTVWGAPGTGVFENDRPVAVSATPALEDAILATGFAYRRGEVEDDNFGHFRRLGLASRGVRRMGAAAADLAWVATGRFDGFWELHLSPWDVAAGAALVRAAGGTVTDFAGGEDWLTGGNVVATNGLLHAPLRAELAASTS